MDNKCVTVIYRSLNQVWNVLNVQNKSSEIQRLMELCHETGLINVASPNVSSSIVPSYTTNNSPPSRENRQPFVVIEGLDGTGKTSLAKYLSKHLGMKLICTPPKHPTITEVRHYFDSQSENLRRAFYSLGNYLAAMQAYNSCKPVIMDRFWHSTASYAMAHIMTKNISATVELEDPIWPEDLLKPDLVIFITVSEEERIRRHGQRNNFTNTIEEQTLAKDNKFRDFLVNCYRTFEGANFIEINVDESREEVEEKMVSIILKKFPGLTPRCTV